MDVNQTVAKIAAALGDSAIGTARGHDDEGRVCWVARDRGADGATSYRVTWKVLGPGARYYVIPGGEYDSLLALVRADADAERMVCWAPGTF